MGGKGKEKRTKEEEENRDRYLLSIPGAIFLLSFIQLSATFCCAKKKSKFGSKID